MDEWWAPGCIPIVDRCRVDVTLIQEDRLNLYVPLQDGKLQPFQEEGRTVQVTSDSVMILALITDLVHPRTGML